MPLSIDQDSVCPGITFRTSRYRVSSPETNRVARYSGTTGAFSAGRRPAAINALTALDGAVRDHEKPQPLQWPPVLHDASQVEQLNRGWQIVPEHGASINRSLKGRLRGFIWREKTTA